MSNLPASTSKISSVLTANTARRGKGNQATIDSAGFSSDYKTKGDVFISGKIKQKLFSI